MAFKTGSGVTLKTAISNSKIVTGNQTGRVGNITYTTLGASAEIARLDLSTGNIFNFNPIYNSSYSYITFEFNPTPNTSPIKNYEFYLFWHNYKDSWNWSGGTFDYYRTTPQRIQYVRFPNGKTTLNNSTSGLLDGRTQVFKFTTINGGDYPTGTNEVDWFGTLYMRNC